MRTVGSKLEALVRRWLEGRGDVRETILEWGRRIATKFKVDNARLYTRAADTGSVQLAEAVSGLCGLVQGLRSEVAQLKAEVGRLQSPASGEASAPTPQHPPAPSPSGRSPRRAGKRPASAAEASPAAAAPAAAPTPAAPAPAAPMSSPLLPTTESEGDGRQLGELDAPTIYYRLMEQVTPIPTLTITLTHPHTLPRTPTLTLTL